MVAWDTEMLRVIPAKGALLGGGGGEGAGALSLLGVSTDSIMVCGKTNAECYFCFLPLSCKSEKILFAFFFFFS